MTNSIYIQFSECGQHIRKWSREPFDGGVLYTPTPNTKEQRDG